MSFWKNVVAKPSLWLAMGAVVGVVSYAMVDQRVGIPSAFATGEGPMITQPVGNLSAESLSALVALDESFSGLVEAVTPSVVNISAGSPDRPMQGAGQGSGVVFSQDGWILTNDHVVAGSKEVTVTLWDGRELKGTVLSSGDTQNDLALVKVEADDLQPATFADSDQVKPGQFAIAVGSPFGLENSVTIGHVSGLGRVSAIPGMGVTRSYTNMIQTDASINPGNSGGPLLNIRGEVIGINTSIFSETGGSMGIGFAIPSSQAQYIAQLMIENDGELNRGYFGVVPRDLKPFEKRELGIDRGAMIEALAMERGQPVGPAAEAGLREGDIVTRIGNFPVTREQDLRNAMLRYKPNDKVEVQYVREGKQGTATITVGDFGEMRAQVSQPMPEFRMPQGERVPFDQLPEEFRNLIPRMDGEQAPESDARPEFPRTGGVRMGVSVESISPALREQYKIAEGTSGVVVQVVEPNSAAARAGIKIGDVITRFDGQEIKSPTDLVTAMRSVRSGDTKQVEFMRFGPNSQSRMSLPVRF